VLEVKQSSLVVLIARNPHVESEAPFSPDPRAVVNLGSKQTEFRNWIPIWTFCSYNKAVYVWDEAKRKSNLKKHGIDFRDAYLVYENPDKCTYDASRHEEYRLMDVAMAVIKGRLLTLVYTESEEVVRVISFRNASREERKRYEEDTK
jgi:uncharacterized protein